MPGVVKALLNEASIVEQAIRDLAERALPAISRFVTPATWQEWTEQLVNDLTWDG